MVDCHSQVITWRYAALPRMKGVFCIHINRLNVMPFGTNAYTRLNAKVVLCTNHFHSALNTGLLVIVNFLYLESSFLFSFFLFGGCCTAYNNLHVCIPFDLQISQPRGKSRKNVLAASMFFQDRRYVSRRMFLVAARQ